MVLRKARRCVCQPVSLVLTVACCCCLYVYVLVSLGGGGGVGVGDGGWPNGSGDSAEAGGWGRGSRRQHEQQVWSEVNDIMRREAAASWQQLLAARLRVAGAACACGNGSRASANCVGALPSVAGVAPSAACPSRLRGATKVKFNVSLTWEDAEAAVAAGSEGPVLAGGVWSPPISCRHSQSLAVVVPFRDRWRQLRTLLSVLHPMLQRQATGCYRVFVVEQYGCGAFNKGRLNNAGFLEALKLMNFTCAIFQDTDIVPEDDRNLYACGARRPRHLAVAVDKNNYRLPYAALVGGVIAFTTGQFFRVNGYSNLYWGWGLEDDDMELRMKVGTKMRYERPPARVARFKALAHQPQKIFRLQAARRKPLLKTAIRRFSKDGLNSVSYRVLLRRELPLFTHLLLDVGEQPLDFELTGTQ